MVLNVILAVIGAILILEGLLVFLFPKQIIKSFMEIKKKKIIRKIGGWEIVIGIFIIILSFLIKISF